MLKRKIQKISKKLQSMFRSDKKKKKFLVCKECNKFEVEVALDIGAVTCAYCVQRQVAPPPNTQPKDPKEKFPRGWALRSRYVHTDGRIFEKGKDTGKKETVSDAKPVDKKTKKDTKKKVTAAKKNAVRKTTKRRK